MSKHRINGVTAGAPLEDGSGAQIAISTASGPALMTIDTAALLALGGVCLHAATNPPLGVGAAMRVVQFEHQAQPDGMQTVGFQIATGHKLWFALEGKALAALMEFLSIATGSAPPPDRGREPAH